MFTELCILLIRWRILPYNKKTQHTKSKTRIETLIIITQIKAFNRHVTSICYVATFIFGLLGVGGNYFYSNKVVWK